MASQTEQISQAVKKLREDLSLTQVQLANALGMTPASIYRYEAGTSTPTTETLVTLWHFALGNGSNAASTFSGILTEAIEPLRSLLEGTPVEKKGGLTSDDLKLQPEERLLVAAFIKMIRSEMFPSFQSIVWSSLGPWLEMAKTEFAKQFSNKATVPERMPIDPRQPRAKPDRAQSPTDTQPASKRRPKKDN